MTHPPDFDSPIKPNLEVKPVNRRFAWHIAPNLFTSFRYAWAGVKYAFQTQRNFRIHVVIAVIVSGLSYALKISAIEQVAIALTIALVLVLELLNTAIESVVDLTVKQSYHELAKIAKDCSAGAVLISAWTAIIIAIIIFFPRILALLSS